MLAVLGSPCIFFSSPISSSDVEKTYGNVGDKRDQLAPIPWVDNPVPFDRLTPPSLSYAVRLCTFCLFVPRNYLFLLRPLVGFARSAGLLRTPALSFLSPRQFWKCREPARGSLVLCLGCFSLSLPQSRALLGLMIIFRRGNLHWRLYLLSHPLIRSLEISELLRRIEAGWLDFPPDDSRPFFSPVLDDVLLPLLFFLDRLFALLCSVFVDGFVAGLLDVVLFRLD